MNVPDFSEDQLASLMRSDFALFAKAAFAALYPGTPFQPAPYLDYLAARVQELIDGKIQNLAITLPPRCLKSFLTSIALPAFLVGQDPDCQVMAVSYAQSLADAHGRDRIKLMRTGFYRAVFGNVLGRAGAPGHIRTGQRGALYATGIDGSATGMGADWLIFDDPQNAQGALSEQVRTSSNRQLAQTFLSRRNDPTTARMLIVMQRLHEDDFVGHALSLPGLHWEVVNLPAIAEDDETQVYDTLWGRQTFRREKGQSLHPERLPLEHLETMRQSLGDQRFATQYQQRPAPAGGGLVKSDWFKRYDHEDLPTTFDEVIQSWDTANKVHEWNDWSVCTTWGRLGQTIYLLHVHRERLQFPDLVRAALRLAERFQPTVVLIEDKASGTQLLQVLREQGFGHGRPIKPMADKEIRMTNQTALIESGRVWIPNNASWVEAYLQELVLFPNARHADQVDSTSQALAYLTSWLDSRGLIDFYRQAGAKASGVPNPALPYVRFRPPSAAVSMRLGSGAYRAGPDGTVWIPEPEAWQVTWDRVEVYDPPTDDWRDLPFKDWAGVHVKRPTAESHYASMLAICRLERTPPS